MSENYLGIVNRHVRKQLLWQLMEHVAEVPERLQHMALSRSHFRLRKSWASLSARATCTSHPDEFQVRNWKWKKKTFKSLAHTRINFSFITEKMKWKVSTHIKQGSNLSFFAVPYLESGPRKHKTSKDTEFSKNTNKKYCATLKKLMA